MAEAAAAAVAPEQQHIWRPHKQHEGIFSRLLPRFDVAIKDAAGRVLGTETHYNVVGYRGEVHRTSRKTGLFLKVEDAQDALLHEHTLNPIRAPMKKRGGSGRVRGARPPAPATARGGGSHQAGADTAAGQQQWQHGSCRRAHAACRSWWSHVRCDSAGAGGAFGCVAGPTAPGSQCNAQLRAWQGRAGRNQTATHEHNNSTSTGTSVSRHGQHASVQQQQQQLPGCAAQACSSTLDPAHASSPA